MLEENKKNAQMWEEIREQDLGWCIFETN